MVNMAPVITLTTDFGADNAYVASMKGVILTINPKVTIVDICHAIEPQNIPQAAFIISTAHHYFPEGTIHLVIVDPGVGSQQEAIILKTPSAFFLSPDNGVLSYIVDELNTTPAVRTSPPPPNPEQRNLETDAKAVAITNSDFWRQQVSNTFHGRDVFAPVAAHLSLGTPLAKFGGNINSIYTFPISWPYHNSEGTITGHVLHIDNFGNLITNIRNSDMPPGKLIIEIAGQRIHGLSLFYSQGDGLLAIIGSSGYLEISLKNGSAASFLSAKVGTELKVNAD